MAWSWDSRRKRWLTDKEHHDQGEGSIFLIRIVPALFLGWAFFSAASEELQEWDYPKLVRLPIALIAGAMGGLGWFAFYIAVAGCLIWVIIAIIGAIWGSA